jgi:hypothetical protein
MIARHLNFCYFVHVSSVNYHHRQNVVCVIAIRIYVLFIHSFHLSSFLFCAPRADVEKLNNREI